MRRGAGMLRHGAEARSYPGLAGAYKACLSLSKCSPRKPLSKMEYPRAWLSGPVLKLNTTVLLNTGLFDSDQLSF